jgi:hypothetical protein
MCRSVTVPVRRADPSVPPFSKLVRNRRRRRRAEDRLRGNQRSRLGKGAIGCPPNAHDTAGALRRRCRFLPLPDAMPPMASAVADHSPYDRLRTDAAIACPCQVADSQIVGQGITSFARVEHRAWTPVQALLPRASTRGRVQDNKTPANHTTLLCGISFRGSSPWRRSSPSRHLLPSLPRRHMLQP